MWLPWEPFRTSTLKQSQRSSRTSSWQPAPRRQAVQAAVRHRPPTVFSIRPPGFPWKENFLLVGKSLGEEDKAVKALNDYQAEADALKADVKGDPKISLVRFLPGKIRLYANKSLIGVILKDAGLARPENQNIDELAAEISAENIEQGDADWIFYSSYGDPAATGETSVVEGAVWPKLGAVKAGQAKSVSDDVWFLGLGPTAPS